MPSASEFLAKFAPTSGTATNSLTPQTDAAVAGMGLSGQMSGGGQPPPTPGVAGAYQGTFQKLSPDTATEKQAQYENATERMNPSAPFDPQSEVGGWTRLMLGFRRGQEREIKYLQNKYGSENVSLDARGAPIVKVLDEASQKPKFITVDADKMTANDFIDVIGTAPELAGSIIAMRAGKNLKGGIFKDLALSALGGETAGMLKDVTVESLDTGSPRVGQIAKERATMVPIDVAVGGGLALFGKAAGKIITPFGDKPGPIQFDADQARAYFKDKYGIDIPLTPGESTGNQFLLRAEAMLKKLPGSSKTYTDIRREQDAAFQKVQDIALGKKTADEVLPTAQEVGEKAIGALESKVAPAVEAQATARTGAIEATSDAIKRIVGGLTKPAPELYKSKVGEQIRAKVTAMRDAFESEASDLYEKAMALPGGKEKILTPGSIATDAESLLKKLPAKDVVKTTDTGLLDELGKPIVKTVSGKEVMREFVPDKVLGKLNELASLKGQKFSLDELKQMRTEVTNDIKVGESIPGVQTHYLGKIRDILTKAMDEAATSAPTPELKTAFQAANDFYKGNVGKFHKPGISSILRPNDAPGYVGDSEIVGRLTSGTEKANDLFRDMKDFLGAKSPEFDSLRRSIADEILSKSSESGGRTINASSLIKNLDSLYNNNREIADEVFGKTLGELGENSKVLANLQSSDRLSYEAVRGALSRSKKDVAKAFDEAVYAQRQAEDVYKNKILKAISERKLSDTPIEPERFVDEFLDKASQRETEQVVTALHDQPEVMQGIRQKTVQKILQSAARKPSPTDPITLGSDITRLPSSESIVKAITGEGNESKLRTILGEDTFNNLVQFSKALKPTEVAEQSFATAGGLSAGMQVGNMLRGGDLSYLANVLKYKVAATLLTTPALKQWVGNRALSEADQKAMVNGLIASAPFVRSLIDDFGEEGAKSAMEQIKGSLDKSMQQPKTKSASEFLKSASPKPKEPGK